ncbi:flavodoxin family protein [Breznakiella homolactica]|uniref:NAD(P)H-dependent oxidoreductase n=1 Tax=Breznakiella homolactica TaxID=2798577 RepID=A0A7T7XK50_9SPIR|nr:NAD(P)H-dependent oxidoreductase [Breznakiella homolactica]QQO07663.1 flavodoxin family protein [Breznakiella homolactica]
MGKKILVITASPNREGNSAKMADAFIRGATEAGHSVTKFETAFKNMRGFTAAPEPDDFSELAPLLSGADVVALASPLYWYSFPAQLKAVVDQLDYSENSPMTKKESYFFVSGGDGNEETFKPIGALYSAITEYMVWKDRGVLQARGLDDAGAIEKSGLLEEAGKLGKAV